jgi:uncharacterized protein YecE (DUF72 family)
MRPGRAFIGTSGWQYRHWADGVFYPKELKQKQWFQYYCQYFDTVEINNTFYNLPHREVFEKWRKNSPDNFQFVVKASRFITHLKKLSDPQGSTLKFLQHASGLSEKLGVVLFQLPPFWNLNLDRLQKFVEYLRTQTIIPDLKIAIELRNPTWNQPAVYEVLKSANITLCFADWPDLIIEDPITADIVYLRRHGSTFLYASSYSKEQIQQDAERIKNWSARGIDVYIFYNNDALGWAVENALSLKKMIDKLYVKG